MEAWVGTLLSFGVGATFVALGFPMYRRMVRPNSIYGFRIRLTLDDPAVWYPVNERSGKHFIVTGLVLIVLGALGLIVAQTEHRQQMIMIAALALALLGPLYSLAVCYRMAKDLAAKQQQGT